MKRLISILVLIAMLMTSLVITVVPVFAEDGSSGQATDPTSIATGSTATGNNVTPGSLTEQYEAEGGWTAVATWDAFKAALAAGNKKIYLTADIPNATNYNAKTSSNADQLDGAVIDGNGYTITAAVPLFQHTKNTTFQNLTLNSTFSATAGYCALAYWATDGYTKMYNVTANVTATYTSNTSGSQQFSALVIYAQSGSAFENVVVNATLDMSDSNTEDGTITKANSVGLLAARAETATVNNCLTRGSVTVGGTAFNDCDKSYNGVGGLVGQASNVTFENCTNEATIEVTAPGNSKNRSIGGIAGFSTGTNSYTNCINSGSITVTYTNNAIALTEASGAVTDTNAQQTGGLIGYMGSATTITKCENRDNVTLTATSSGTMTAADDNATEASYTLKTYAGGVVGYAAAVATLQDVWNSGNVSLTNNIDGITISGAKLTKAHEGYAGGLFGCAAKGLNTTVSAETVGFTVKNTGTVNSNYYAGGVVGAITTQDTSFVPNFINCLNDGEIICTGIAAGGIIGSTKEGVNIEDSVNNGKIVFTSGKPGSVTSIGGMIGDANVSAGNVADTYLTTISYCINNGELVSGDTSSGANEHFGGLVGRFANPAPYRISYCINNGNITAAAHDTSYVGGLVGRYQGYGCTGTTTAEVTHCVNTGSLTASYAGGFFGRTNIGGDGTTNTYVLNFDASYCVNAGAINAYIAAGFVAHHDGDSATKTIDYDFDNCVNVGTITAGGTASGGVCKTSNTTIAMDNCLISGEFTGTGAKYILAPEDVVTGSGNYYNSNIVIDANNAKGATSKANDEINALIRGEGTTTVIFSRNNAEWLYKVTGDEALAPYVVLDFTSEESKETYFGTQAALDAVYDEVYAEYYGNAEDASYTVTVSPNIKLTENGGGVMLDFNNPREDSQLVINVVQSDNSGENFKLTSNSGVLEFWFVQDGREVKNGENLFEFDRDDSGYHEFGAVIKDEASLYPDTYTGSVTFNIELK